MKKVLVVIDCQNDFITGSLRNEDAIKAVPNIIKKIKEFNGDLIIVTRDTHTEDYLNTSEGKKLPVVHCVKGTEGWELEPNIKAALAEIDERMIPVNFIEKPTFGTNEISLNIKTVFYTEEDELEIEFVGFCTDICVVSNVLMVKSNFYENARIVVDASATAGVTPESHRAALLTMKMCQIDVINEE